MVDWSIENFLISPNGNHLKRSVLAGFIQFFFSIEFFFGIFLFAGVIKGNPSLSWVPIDLTLLGFALSIIAGIVQLFKHGWIVPRSIVRLFILFSLFLAWVSISLLWSDSWSYGGGKVLYLISMGFWSYLAGALFIGGDNTRCLRFFSLIVLMSIWMAVELVLLILSGSLFEEWDFVNNYLGFGRLIGLSVIFLMGIILWARLRRWSIIVLGVLAAFLITILMISGGRGPFLATLLVFVVPVARDVRVYNKKIMVKKYLFIFGSILALILVGFVLVGNKFFGFTTVDRIWSLLETGGHGSAYERIWFFKKAWLYFLESPVFGHGIGSFGILLEWGDVRIYPHNIVLEILVELGLIGLILFLGIVFSSLRGVSILRIRKDMWATIIVMIFINTLFNSMVSGDLPDNRVFFAALGLCAGRFGEIQIGRRK